MAALGDVLLVLLGGGPGTAHDLQQRHAATLGPDHVVDVTRVAWTLSRLERHGDVQSGPMPGRPKQLRFALTEAGDHKQRTWMLGLPADATPEEIRTRVLLAVEATDRSTFEMVVAVCLARLEVGRRQAVPAHRGRAITAETARAELAEASATAQLAWLRQLSARHRERD